MFTLGRALKFSAQPLRNRGPRENARDERREIQPANRTALNGFMVVASLLQFETTGFKQNKRGLRTVTGGLVQQGAFQHF
jgi:hypothetical protein